MFQSFLVGCPRSGTTLLQSMVANHPLVYSIPETHFFSKIRGRLSENSGPFVSPRAAHLSLSNLARETGQASPKRVLPYWPFPGAYADAFAGTLDAAAQHEGCAGWIEKSPPHLHRIQEISHSLPRTQFVHIVRDGKEVVASIYRLCQSSPASWRPQILGRRRASDTISDEDLLIAIAQRWNSDMTITRAHRDDPQHLWIEMHNLLTDPTPALEAVARFLDIPFSDSMLRHWESAERVVGWRSDQEHMQAPFEAVDATRPSKFAGTFSEDQRRLVESQLLFGGDPVLLMHS